jgi:hypothetical protein
MGDVNAELAEMYGTVADASGEEAVIEKIAAALEEEGIDFDSLPEEEQQALLSEALDDEAGEEVEGEKTAEAKLAEADMMGRIMAHSFTQESDLLKEAKKRKAKRVAPGLMRRGVLKAKRLLRKGKEMAGKGYKKSLRFAKSKPGVGVLAGLGGAGAGYAAGRMKESADESFNEAVDERVLDILADLGLVEEDAE